jgi:hypothetical protein
MGEKGIAADALGGVAGVVESTSIIERAGSVVTTSVTNAGGELVETVRTRSLEAIADGVIAEGAEALRRSKNGDTQGDPSSFDPPEPPSQG